MNTLSAIGSGRVTPVENILKLSTAAGFLALWIFSGFGHARAEDSWPGNRPLSGGKGYVQTPMGQVHYRARGPASSKTPMLLLHQTPWSMIEFARIQDSLAKLGIRSIAIDTPGYGMSDEPPGDPTLKDLADNIIPVLDNLRLSKVVVAGHHTGASIAVSFAANHPDRVAAVILHGVPLFNDQDLAERLNRKPYDRTPQADGSHVSRLFTGKSGAQSPEVLRNRTVALLSMFSFGRDVGHHAVYRYRMEPDARAIKAPGLLITDVTDPLHVMDDRMAKLRPDFKYVEFATKTANIDMMNHPDKWAEIAADFAAKVAK